MSADKHPAEVLADTGPTRRGLMWHEDVEGMLRRIPTLESQRDAANQVANGMHAMLCDEVEKAKALEAQRDQLRAEVDRWSVAAAGFEAERNELRAEVDGLEKTVIGQGAILRAVVIAVRGEPPAGTGWSSHDAAERVGAAMAALAGALQAVKKLTAEVEALRADAERYRWLARRVSAHGICDGWQFGFPTALTLPAPALAMRDPEAALALAIDAARGAA